MRLLGLVFVVACSTLYCTTICTTMVRGDVVAIGQFVGDNSEDFNSFEGGLGGKAFLDIFDLDATLRKRDGGSVKIESNSSRGGDIVFPRSFPVFAGQFAVMDWEFHTPISQFGGFFENNSRFDDVVVEFFDAQDQLIDSVTATVPFDAQAWTWNGWKSTTPIHRITTAGNDVAFLNGFVWYDDMEITYFTSVPEPAFSGLAIAGIFSIVLMRRRYPIHARKSPHNVRMDQTSQNFAPVD